jgi:hypothetical protein
MNLQENVNRIKEVMGILKEETELELRKIMTDKFSGIPYYGTFERQGDYVVHKTFSKARNANIITKFKPTEDFYTSEVLDGPEKGRVVKVYTDDAKKKRETLTKSELQIKFDEKVKNFPCLNPDDVVYLRQTSDGKVLAGYLFTVGSDDSTEYVTYFNLDDKTYFIKGGEHDGEQGEFSCNGVEVKWGKVTKSGTKKRVVSKMLADEFEDITSSNPIVYGMRDHTPEPENGLIYRLQQKLKDFKYYTAEPDGQFGPKTLKAVMKFQEWAKNVAYKGGKIHADGKVGPFIVDGKVGPQTIQAMGLTD